MNYVFGIKAYNVHGESPLSSTVSFTTTKVPNKMAKPTLTQVGTNVQLQFGAPTLNGGILINYVVKFKNSSSQMEEF